MSGGSVPGSGHHDTVPRTLEAGAFVIRKSAVRKYGGTALARLANTARASASALGVARFAVGGPVRLQGTTRSSPSDGFVGSAKRNRDVAEAEKMIDLGLQGLREYMNWSQSKYGGSLDATWKTFQTWNPMAMQDRSVLQAMAERKTLTANERQTLDQIKQTWRFAMSQPLVYGKDLERELIDHMEQNQGEFYRQGGLSKSDTVPAMLTPGEYVVNREAVARWGSGFFESINNLSMPARALAQRVQGFATGGLVRPAGVPLASPVLSSDGAPARTVRVELAAGDRKVSASIDARDESRLLSLLEIARARAA